MARSSTAFRQERPALSACAINIDNVSAGGNNRSLWRGSNASMQACSSGLASKLADVSTYVLAASLRTRGRGGRAVWRLAAMGAAPGSGCVFATITVDGGADLSSQINGLMVK